MFSLLLDTVLPEALEEGVPEDLPRHWRNRGWSEIASLLAASDYSFDERRAALSREAVEQRISDCRSVIL
ncbi:hypothetical protein ACFORG_17495 [Lutimaribacter marinistellae]|uniref:Uncharacterized protein n=1 Tax=Lutimaribacter marinistellae TaxID=1820329 RepID=A0ABV7TJ26_9RHOB